ncbi:hypothetical protein [Cnuella takakiae]|nr:hypothetical protein [Cnuella takakiae]OLY92960.1 hypothetical protein BUE76_14470 [Cnuella takakiae]
MRIIKLALLSFLFFGVLFFLMAQLVPSEVRISKAINFAPNDTAILKKVRDTAMWPSWHPAYANGSPAKQKVSLRTQNDSVVIMDITHASGKSVSNGWELHRFGAADSLTLQWYMDFKLSPLPWHRFSSLFYEGTYGRMMEQGLRNLKAGQQQAP